MAPLPLIGVARSLPLIGLKYVLQTIAIPVPSSQITRFGSLETRPDSLETKSASLETRPDSLETSKTVIPVLCGLAVGVSCKPGQLLPWAFSGHARTAAGAPAIGDSCVPCRRAAAGKAQLVGGSGGRCSDRRPSGERQLCRTGCGPAQHLPAT